MDIEKLKKLCEKQALALQANGIFHTPVAKSKLTSFGDWDEYQLDAIDRTRDCQEKAAELGILPN